MIDLDARPILIAVAGPNGAGKTTFYETQLSYTGLPFVNADVIATETTLGAYEAATVADTIRQERLKRRESFIFETVFSDPVGDKLRFLLEAAASGYTVLLFFIGLSDAEKSANRVELRVLQGGHDVPTGKITTRFPRTLANLRKAMRVLPAVRVYDNDDLRTPYRFCLATENGRVTERVDPLPLWLASLLPRRK